MVENTLVPTKLYLQAGSHIGTKYKSGSMKRFVFKVRPDRLRVIDVGLIDDRLRIATEFLSNFKPQEIIIASRKEYAKKPILLFAKLVGAKAVTGRFVPGTLTNPNAKKFLEGKVMFIIDPSLDKQAIVESSKIRIPVISLASTDNILNKIDLVIPINNNGRQSIALALLVIARELMIKRKEIKNESEFKYTMKDFEYPLEEAQKEEKRAFKEESRSHGRGRKPF